MLEELKKLVFKLYKISGKCDTEMDRIRNEEVIDFDLHENVNEENWEEDKWIANNMEDHVESLISFLEEKEEDRFNNKELNKLLKEDI